MGWGDTGHTHTYTRARGLGQAPRGCWGAPRCSGMHRGALECTTVYQGWGSLFWAGAVFLAAAGCDTKDIIFKRGHTFWKVFL